LIPSSIIKISNVHTRDAYLSDQAFEDLNLDMLDEMQTIPGLKRLKIVRNGEERLGAEVGSVFVEFSDKKGAQQAIDKLKGRVYDCKKINVCFIEETLYFSELYIK